MDGWTYYRPVTILDSSVDENLSSFPFLLAVDADAHLGANAKADGSDLRITTEAAPTTPLAHSLEQWTLDGGNVTMRARVAAPSILATGGASLRLWYGNAGASDAQSPADVWDDDFVLVSEMLDGSANNQVAVRVGPADGDKTAANEPIQAAAKIHYGQQFDGSNDYVNFGTSVPATPQFTISLWLNSGLTRGGIFSRSLGTSWTQERLVLHRYNTDKLDVTISNGTNYQRIPSAGDLPKGDQVHVTVTLDGAKLRIYFNGVLDSETTAWYVPDTSGVKTWLGRVEGLSPDYFTGLIDDFQYSDIARSAAWAKFLHANTVGSGWQQTWSDPVGGGIGHYRRRLLSGGMIGMGV